MPINLDGWQAEFAAVVEASLVEFRRGANDEMQMFAVDCHPWNGFVTLAFLTYNEARKQPELADTSEMAAWHYYDFASSLKAWQPSAMLGTTMRAAYEAAGNEHSAIACNFIECCAAAVRTTQVQTALYEYRRAADFTTSIPHPDT